MNRETLKYIQKYHMLEPGDRVVAGLSGGADSVCLLHLLWCLREELGIALFAVHVHHGLRGEEADRDAQFSSELCGRLGIPCRVERIFVEEEARKAGISVEEAGRAARYRILQEEAERLALEPWTAGESGTSMELGTAGESGTDVEPWTAGESGTGVELGFDGPARQTVRIATAHHGDDNAETILHNLLRGSGLTGLSGIPPVRGRIIRPILWAEREDILSYLEEQGLPHMEDSTNGQSEYTRNKLRNKIIPLLRSEVNEQAVRNILRAGELIGGADRYLEKQAKQWLRENGKAEDRGYCLKENGVCRLPAAALREEDPVLGGYILRAALRDLGCPLKDITAGHIGDILSLTGKPTGKRAALPHGLSAVREYDQLILTQQEGPVNFINNSEKEEIFRLSLSDIPEEGLILPGKPFPALRFDVFIYENQMEIPKNQYTKWFDYDKIKDTLFIRHRRPGDYLALPSGGRKTVKSYLIDEKVPRQQRDGIWLLAEGSHILWMVGFRISEDYKITGHTRKVLRVQLDGGTSGD